MTGQITTSYAQFHMMETARIARDVHARMMRGETGPFHVYFKTLRFECFPEGADVDREEWRLAWPEHVPGDLTVDGLIYWFRYRADRVPYLPGD